MQNIRYCLSNILIAIFLFGPAAIPARAQLFKLSRQTFASVTVKLGGSDTEMRAIGGWSTLGTMNSSKYHMGLVTPVLMHDEPGTLPQVFDLSQNFPNPFNASTRFNFKVPVASRIEIGIYTLLGQRVRTLVSGYRAPGFYSVLFDGRDDRGQALASGLYFCRLSTDAVRQTVKFSLVR